MSNKILNFGSLNYDYVYHMKDIVRPGETAMASSMIRHIGGKGLNQSVAMARAGLKVYHAGMVGSDGDDLINVCKKNEINVDFLSKCTKISGHTIIQVDESGQNSIILYGGSNFEISKKDIDEVLSNFGENDYVILQNEISNVDYIVDSAFEKNMKIILNPSPFNDNLNKVDFNKIDLFFINEIEGSSISLKSNYGSAMGEMLRTYTNASIVMTLGDKGVLYGDKNGVIQVPAIETKVVDTTAAGDTFTGYFMYGLVNGFEMEKALSLATKASSYAIGRAGAVPSIPYMNELEL